MYRRLIAALSAALVLTVTTGAGAQPAARGDRPGAPLQGRRPMGRRGVRLTAGQEAKLLAVLKDKRPGFHRRLARLREENPRAYRRTLGWAWRWYQRWKRMSPKEKALVKDLEDVRLHIARVLRAVRETKAHPTAEQKRQLLQAVTKAFETEQALQAIRIKKLEKEIQRIKEEMRDRFARRKELIAERLDRMLSKTDRPSRRRRRMGRIGPATRPGK